MEANKFCEETTLARSRSIGGFGIFMPWQSLAGAQISHPMGRNAYGFHLPGHNFSHKYEVGFRMSRTIQPINLQNPRIGLKRIAQAFFKSTENLRAFLYPAPSNLQIQGRALKMEYCS